MKQACRQHIAITTRRLTQAQKLAHVGNWEIDLETETVWASEETYDLYGLKMEDPLSHNKLLRLVHMEDKSRLSIAFERLLNGKADFNIYFRIIKAGSSEVRHMHSVAVVEDNSSGKPVKILGAIHDVTERVVLERELLYKNQELMTLQEGFMKYEQRIKHMAYYDYITDLPNRIFFLDKLNHAISLSKINGTKLVVVLLNLDNFKTVNDTLGHASGDELLIAISKRLLTCIDEAATVARINGDEFSLLVEDIKQEICIIPLLERLKSTFEEPFKANENMINLTASFGVSVYPDDGDTEEELISNANIAMYKAKEFGKNRYQVFHFKMKEELWQKINIELLLRKAIKYDEFTIYYQPQYAVETGKLKLRGFEALIRWISPEIGFLNPMEFIPIAEETGLISQIGEWVLNSASSACKNFEDKYGRDLIMAVNISPVHLRRGEFQETVMEAIRVSGIKPSSLEIEVTESIFIDSTGNIANKLSDIKELGVGIALDDFGTGYSSLNYLRKLPITLLKIDKSFVQEIDSLNPHNDLTVSIIALVKKLNIKTMAEGVETLEQLNYLINANCDYLQGYYLGKPEPEDLLEVILERAY